MFQSTHPRGVRHVTIIQSMIVSCFNPRTHEGCDLPAAPPLASVGRFNPRTHEGCDYLRLARKAEAIMFQSTHPRGVRHLNFLLLTLTKTVSIHAPTRGATIKNRSIFSFNRFQSTHPRGVRQVHDVSCKEYQTFQSTHPRGVRLRTSSRAVYILSFNPRTHEGCDEPSSCWCSPPYSFNPRTHEGCDVFVPWSDLCGYYVSIHAPTRGATRHRRCYATNGEFQSTHPRGVRHVDAGVYQRRYSFNPRTHEGCDTARRQIAL